MATFPVFEWVSVTWFHNIFYILLFLLFLKLVDLSLR